MAIYWKLRNAVFEDPGIVSTLGDETLRTLCHDLPSEHGHLIKSHLIAEVLLRRWLYVPEQRGLFQATIDTLVPKELIEACDKLQGPRGCPNSFSPPEMQFKDGSMEKLAWDHLCSRVKAFTEADGMIPVVCPDGSAVAIPFKLNDGGGADSPTWIHDAAGIPAAEWNTQAKPVWAYVGKNYSVSLGCRLPPSGDASPNVTGGSLCLPLYLAVMRKTGVDFRPLDVLTTGAIREGVIHSVNGISEKSDLAKKLGVSHFIAPGIQQNDTQLGLPERIAITDAAKRIKERLTPPRYWLAVLLAIIGLVVVGMIPYWFGDKQDNDYYTDYVLKRNAPDSEMNDFLKKLNLTYPSIDLKEFDIILHEKEDSAGKVYWESEKKWLASTTRPVFKISIKENRTWKLPVAKFAIEVSKQLSELFDRIQNKPAGAKSKNEVADSRSIFERLEKSLEEPDALNQIKEIEIGEVEVTERISYAYVKAAKFPVTFTNDWKKAIKDAQKHIEDEVRKKGHRS